MATVRVRARRRRPPSYLTLREVPIFRLKDRFKFLLERWVQRGVRARLLFIAAVIILIALLGGMAAWLFSDQFGGLGDAVWWAFLRLTDPGYLGDDAGAFVRTLSTVITVLGYVLFLGSLVAILTQWLNQTMHRLESGLTPIAVRDHVLILGWTNRTPAIVKEIMLSEHRVRHFLRKRGARKLRIVVLIDEVTLAHVLELKESLGDAWEESRIILRSGSSLRVEHLRRVAYHDAAVVILPGADFTLGGAAATDARVIKTLISLASTLRVEHGTAPAVVAEIYDELMVPVAEKSYGVGAIDIVAGDAFISRLIAQNVRHRGLSFLYAELLSHLRGNEVYIRSFPDFAGSAFGSIRGRFHKAVLLGVVRLRGKRFDSHLNPGDAFRLESEDRLVFIARSYDDCVAALSVDAEPVERASHNPEEPASRESNEHASQGATDPAAADQVEHSSAAGSSDQALGGPSAPLLRNDEGTQHRVLILGWSHKVMPLLREFSSYPNEHFEVDVLSRVPAAEREPAVERSNIDRVRVRVRHIEGDFAIRQDIQGINPGSYTNIVFLASDWMDSEEESDARTILGYVLLRSMLEEEMEVGEEKADQSEVVIEKADQPEVAIDGVDQPEVGIQKADQPEVVIELLDPENARLFRRRAGEVIVSPLILSHILAHVALRRELSVVFNELFGAGGAEFFFRPVSRYNLAGKKIGTRELQAAAQARGEIALGVRLSAEFGGSTGGIRLNPSPLDRWALTEDDEIILLTTS